jgi:hypothetical protein
MFELVNKHEANRNIFGAPKHYLRSVRAVFLTV